MKQIIKQIAAAVIGLLILQQSSYGQTSLTTGISPSDAYLVDTAGKLVSLKDFTGKSIVIDFWFTECGGCKGFYLKTLSHIIRDFKQEKNLLFISISSDKDRTKWLNSVATSTFTSYDAINLYTGGRGFNHEFLKYYDIHRFPSLILIDKRGRTTVLYNSPQSLDRFFIN